MTLTICRLCERSAAECLMDYRHLERYLVSRGACTQPIALDPARATWSAAPAEPLVLCIRAHSIEEQVLKDLGCLSTLADKSCDSSFTVLVQSRLLRTEARLWRVSFLQQMVQIPERIYMLDRVLRCSGGYVPPSMANGASGAYVAVSEN
jgi:ferritin heavy chain